MRDTMKRRILFIEDDPFLGDVLTQKLRHEGYDVSLVQDGAEGLKQMALQKPDLVLLDIILPTMNGYEILEERQKDPVLYAIPVIIVSNSGQPVEIDRALALGVKDYLVKAQLEPEEVLAKIRMCIGDGEQQTNTTATQLAGKKILYVEDDRFLSDILAVKLSHEGCIGLYATTGEEALEILKHEMPDVILLDIILPGIDGLGVLKAVRENPNLAHLPVIVLSNLGQKEDMEKAKALGATKYFIKAEHDINEIFNEVVKVLNEKGVAGTTATSPA